MRLFDDFVAGLLSVAGVYKLKALPVNAQVPPRRDLDFLHRAASMEMREVHF